MAIKVTNAFSSLEQKFELKLQAKTGWGRNEVMKAFKEARREVIEELLEASDGDGRDNRSDPHS